MRVSIFEKFLSSNVKNLDLPIYIIYNKFNTFFDFLDKFGLIFNIVISEKKNFLEI